MKKAMLFITLLSLLFLWGCGNKEEETTVKVEIEKISDVAPAVTSSGETAGKAMTTVSDEAVGETPTTASGEASVETQVTSSEEAAAEVAQDVTASGDNAVNGIKVAYCGATAKEILEKAKQELKALGYELIMLECDNYTKPNEMVMVGEADACLGENQAYLDSFNMINSTNLTVVEREYIEPYGIFPGKSRDLNHLGNGVSIAVMQGDITTARTLYLLQQKGLIELKAGSGYQACMDDIVSNPHGIKLEALNFQETFPDRTKYDLIVCDYNYAILAGIDPEEALGYENRNSGLTDLFAICLVAPSDKKDSEKIGKLCKALNSESVEKYINESYYHSVIDYK